jgi:hypothetical protein
MNTEAQYSAALKLKRRYEFEEDKNILLFKKRIFGKKFVPKFENQLWDIIQPILFFGKKGNITSGVNFFIYVIIFSLVFFKHKRKKNNLIIGNFNQVANKTIINLFSNYFDRVLVLDEGVSTIDIFKKRSEDIEKKEIPALKRLFKTFSPKKELIFFTNFSLNNNGKDKIDNVQVFDSLLKLKVRKKNHLYFIGTYLVEANYITIQEFKQLLNFIVLNNKGKKIFYVSHPREHVIFKFNTAELKGIEILKLETSIEKFFQAMDYFPAVIASTISTGFIYSADIFGDNVNYQTYKLNLTSIKNQTKVKQLNLVYEKITEKLQEFNNQIIE